MSSPPFPIPAQTPTQQTSPSSPHKIPITIFTGALGSGKTSIILALLKIIRSRHAQSTPSHPSSHGNDMGIRGNKWGNGGNGGMPRIAIIKNEYGDSGVDSQLFSLASQQTPTNTNGTDGINGNFGIGDTDTGTMNAVNAVSGGNGEKGPLLDIKEMDGGCVCCTLLGPLDEAISALINPPSHSSTTSTSTSGSSDSPTQTTSSTESETQDKNTSKTATSTTSHPQWKRPDMIWIETSGSLAPLNLILHLRRIEGVRVDCIVTVVDCESFPLTTSLNNGPSGNTGPSLNNGGNNFGTVKAQTQITDLVLLNKHRLVSERRVDLVVDGVRDLLLDSSFAISNSNSRRGVNHISGGEDVPLIRVDRDGEGLDVDLILGTHSHRHSHSHTHKNNNSKEDECTHCTEINKNHMTDENAHIHLSLYGITSLTQLEAILCNSSVLTREWVYRIKGYFKHPMSSPTKTNGTDEKNVTHECGTDGQITTTTTVSIVNWSFGRYDITPLLLSTGSDFDRKRRETDATGDGACIPPVVSPKSTI